MDAGRRERTLKLPAGAKRDASVAASLLLQYAVGQYREKSSSGNADPDESVRIADARDVMDFVAGRGPEEFVFCYGEHGKPAFTDPEMPQFNLSHSGDYVALVLSDAQCGIDLQRMENGRNVNSIAERFFAPGEEVAVRQGGEETFFRLWTRKEALAKCSGEGIAPGIGRDIREIPGETGCLWIEWSGLPGYLLAACEMKRN